MNKLMQRYPAVEDLVRVARRRVPRFAFDYVEGSTGREACVRRNRTALDEVTLMARYLGEEVPVELTTEVLGLRHAMPCGIAPMGLSGLVWPGAEVMLAAAAETAGIPYVLSTVCTVDMERIAQLAPHSAWFQLYVARDPGVTRDLIERAAAARFRALVVTVDVPAVGRRERDIRNGLTVPPRRGLGSVLQGATRPAWALAVLRGGLPRFRTIERYVPRGDEVTGYLGQQFVRTRVSVRMLEKIRATWSGPLVVKGIVGVDDARQAVAAGADAVIVSNHGGRQLDAAPSPVEVLPAIAAAIGDRATVMADSGVTSGVDVARCMACGADFVFCGRAFMYGVAVAGQAGANHVIEILAAGLRQTLAQIGCPTPAQLGPGWLAESK